MNAPPFSKMNARGQATLPDILLATFIFFLILAGMYSYTQNTQTVGQESIARRNLDGVTANVAEFIIKNPGIPSTWEYSNDINQVTQFGLAQKDRVLNPQKVVAFVNYGNLDYVNTKSKLHIPQYEFYAEFSGGANLATGQVPSLTGAASVVQRLVTINGIETIFTLTVYEN